MIITEITPAWQQWALARFQSGRIQNLLFSEFVNEHPSHSTIDLSSTDIIILGSVCGVRKAFVVRLLENKGLRLFVGAFKVRYEGCEVWYYSLPSFKSRVLQITDRLSFERSAYIIVASGENGVASSARLVRLRCVRTLCMLGSMALGAGFDRRYQHRALVPTARRLMFRHVEALINVYARAEPSLTSAGIAAMVRDDVNAALIPYFALDTTRFTALIEAQTLKEAEVSSELSALEPSAQTRATACHLLGSKRLLELEGVSRLGAIPLPVLEDLFGVRDPGESEEFHLSQRSEAPSPSSYQHESELPCNETEPDLGFAPTSYQCDFSDTLLEEGVEIGGSPDVVIFGEEA